MTEHYRFFGSAEGDIREYNQLEFAEVFQRFFKTGIFPKIDQELMVVETDPQRLAVRVGPGQAWMQGYWYKNDGYKEIDLPPADVNYPRIHRIVLRLDTIDQRRIIATVKAGMAQALPIAPELERNEQFYEVSLATVYVAPGATKVLTRDITDDRYCDDYCGRAVSHEYEELRELIASVDLTAEKVKLSSPNFSSQNVKDAMNELFTNVGNGKNAVAAAITGKGVEASGSDTFGQLASKIGAIQRAAGNAGSGDVLAGKTFSANGVVEATGTMPNHGAPVFTPGTGNIPIPAGYTNGGGYVVGDPDLHPGNILQGVNIFGVQGEVVPASAVIASGTFPGPYYGETTIPISLPFMPNQVMARCYEDYSDYNVSVHMYSLSNSTDDTYLIQPNNRTFYGKLQATNRHSGGFTLLIKPPSGGYMNDVTWKAVK